MALSLSNSHSALLTLTSTKVREIRIFLWILLDIIARDVSYQPEQTIAESVNEILYGKDQMRQDYEIQVQNYLSAKAKKELNHHGRLGAGHVRAVLDTIDGAMWTGPVYMARFTPMDVVFDTGSDWLVIEDNQCEECEGNTFNGNTGVRSGGRQTERVYGNAWLRGVEYENTVCLLLSACVSDFEYFGIWEQRGISEPIDGILGLARGDYYFYLGDKTRQSGPLYIDAMFNEDLIDQKIFSFYLSSKEKSYVDFGTPQEDAVKSLDDIRYIKNLDDFFWSAYNQGVAIGTIDQGEEKDNTYRYS